MIKSILATFPICLTNKCISEHEDIEIGIYDHPKSWCKVSDDPRHFTVYNPNASKFHLFAIDKCCLDATFLGKRCDLGVFKENETFWLIEIKDTTPKNQLKLLRPIAQLENTLVHFESHNFFDTYPNKFAVLCWKANPPVPLTDCSFASAKVRFFKKYGFFLKEGNSLTV